MADDFRSQGEDDPKVVGLTRDSGLKMGSTAGDLEGVVLSRQYTLMTLRGQKLPGKGEDK